MKRFGLLLGLAAIGLSACGSSNVSYIPSAWGPSGYCYYLYSPYECYGHHYGIPMAMPLYWHQRYAGYYDSPAYIQVYVPSRYRTTASSRARIFERTYSSQIKSQSRVASWKGSNGKVVSGSKVGRSATFGSGGARSSGFSGGSFRSGSSKNSNPCASVHYTLAGFFSSGSRSSGGFSSSRSSSSFSSSSSSRSISSGGSARSGGSLGSKSGTRSGHSC